jgi:hypothetical protein
MKNARNVCAIGSIIGGFVMLAGASSADTLPSPGSTPQPPEPLPQLTAEWWQWVYSIPQPYAADAAISNPIADTTGASCMVGQRGSVWFLAGDNLTPAQPGQVIRSCSIPEGVSILFPVINFVNFNTPGCPTGTLPVSVKDLLPAVQQSIEAVDFKSISVTVDGVDVKKTLLQLIQSEPFELAFPTQNSFGPYACNPPNTPPPPPPPPINPLPAGIYWPAVAEGYYVWLPPPPVGPHTIAFYASAATAPIGPSYQDVIYNITVCARLASNTCPEPAAAFARRAE